MTLYKKSVRPEFGSITLIKPHSTTTRARTYAWYLAYLILYIILPCFAPIFRRFFTNFRLKFPEFPCTLSWPARACYNKEFTPQNTSFFRLLPFNSSLFTVFQVSFCHSFIKSRFHGQFLYTTRLFILKLPFFTLPFIFTVNSSYFTVNSSYFTRFQALFPLFL